MAAFCEDTRHDVPSSVTVSNSFRAINRSRRAAIVEIDLWAWQHGVVLAYSRPGKPTDNVFAEGFNSRVRQGMLFWFLSLGDAWCTIEAWRRSLQTK